MSPRRWTMPHLTTRQLVGSMTGLFVLVLVVSWLQVYGWPPYVDDSEPVTVSYPTALPSPSPTPTGIPTPRARPRKTASAAPVSTPSPTGKPRMRVNRRAVESAAAQATPTPVAARSEVWQQAQAAHPENPTNPLAGRVWGVYNGPQDQMWSSYATASGTNRALLDVIGRRPRFGWFGSWIPDDQAGTRVRDYIATAQAGDPTRLVGITVFRMEPWEGEACHRGPTPTEQASYRQWIANFAAGIGSSPVMVVLQPDGPFLRCSPAPDVVGGLLSEATRTLASLPNAAVYIDAGAGDWCANNGGAAAADCATTLEQAGVRYARGFALNATHYTGPDDDIALGRQIAGVLAERGYGTKHFIVNTAQSGNPTQWANVVPSTPGGLRDDALVCTTRGQSGCITLGIPPTAQAWNPAWGLRPDTVEAAAALVDGFVWFGRPWLHLQNSPFVLDRALNLARSTPWPLPPS